jgi:hypothetical protein
MARDLIGCRATSCEGRVPAARLAAWIAFVLKPPEVITAREIRVK